MASAILIILGIIVGIAIIIKIFTFIKSRNNKLSQSNSSFWDRVKSVGSKIGDCCRKLGT